MGRAFLAAAGGRLALDRPPWLAKATRSVTLLGDALVLVGVNLAVAGSLAARRKFRALAFVLASVTSGLLVLLLLKGGFARPRPQLVPYLWGSTAAASPAGIR